MSRRRALLVCPGRGSYGREQLGYLANRPAAEELLAACDTWRAARGAPTVTELDSASRFSSKRHIAGENASLLTFACSMADLAELDSSSIEIVGVTGNSMGWYTALAVAGALSLSETIRLVDTMGSYQAGNLVGGQLLYPLVGSDWVHDDALSAEVQRGLESARAAGHVAEWSIRLGGFAVLGADRGGVKHLLEVLEPQSRGPRTFPVQLPLHSAFHTSLLAETSARAKKELSLRFQPPRVPLIDGRGHVFRPRWADPAALEDYTLGQQVFATYDYTAALKSALHHTGAELVVILGPGNSLGAPTAQVLVADNWGGLGSKGQFIEAQESEPTLLSFGLEAQRARLTQ